MKKYKLVILVIIIIVLAMLFSINSKTVIDSVKFSLTMCYRSVIPSLFPFFIICEFFTYIASGMFNNLSSTAFLSSLITGFPTGVKNVCALYRNGEINNSTASQLLYCTANASPAYITAFIGVCIMGNKQAGYILLVTQTIAAFACAVFFGCFKKIKKRNQKSNIINITESACNSISNSVISCLYVCGYIIFFGVIADILISLKVPDAISEALVFLPKNQAKALIVGSIEITRGMLMLDLQKNSNLIIASIILAFSGISVIMQCISCAVNAGLSSKPIIKGKLIYTILMPLITTCLTKLTPIGNSRVRTENGGIIPLLLFIIFIVFCIITVHNIFDKSSKKIYNK